VRAMLCYQGVTIGLPSGGGPPCSKDGSGVNWVAWSTGELRVDPVSYSLCFIPSGAQNFTAKPMGCILGVNVVPGPGGSASIIAHTNDLIHSAIRLSFEYRADEEAFIQVAQTCEAKRSAVRPRRSSMESRPVGWSGAMDPNMEDLADTIRQRCAGAWPLIYCGAELYGPDPNGDNGSEVLLGRGAVVLLDPLEQPGAELSSAYELLFYDETNGEPTLRVPVGPTIQLSPQAEAEGHPGRLSAPRISMVGRMSMGASVAACFDFSVQGCSLSALTFDRDGEAQGFVRDLSVRMRLARTSLKTVREMHSVGDLQGQLFTMKRNSLAARAGRWALGLLVCIIGLMLFNGCTLYFNDDKPLLEVIGQVIDDTAGVADVIAGTVRHVTAVVCHVTDGGRTVPVAAVEACAAMYSAVDAQTCIQELKARVRG